MKTRGSLNPGFTGFEGISGKLWGTYKRGALKRGIPFKLEITEAWQVFQQQRGLCAMTGLPLQLNSTRAQSTGSLDRLDAAKPYEPGNIQWVLKEVNVARNTLGVEEFVELCRKVTAHHDSIR